MNAFKTYQYCLLSFFLLYFINHVFAQKIKYTDEYKIVEVKTSDSTLEKYYYFLSDERLNCIETYKNNIKDGLFRNYYFNCSMLDSGYYVNNKKEGLWYIFSPDKKINRVYLYKNDKIVKITLFDKYGDEFVPSKEININGFFKKKTFIGKINNNSQHTYTAGIIHYSFIYKNGRMENIKVKTANPKLESEVLSQLINYNSQDNNCILNESLVEEFDCFIISNK